MVRKAVIWSIKVLHYDQPTALAREKKASLISTATNWLANGPLGNIRTCLLLNMLPRLDLGAFAPPHHGLCDPS